MYSENWPERRGYCAGIPAPAADRNGGPDRVYQDSESRCRVVDIEREDRRIAGYDVEYRYKGDVFVSRLDYDPGNKLRVRVAISPAD